jgi:hypothetical protein
MLNCHRDLSGRLLLLKVARSVEGSNATNTKTIPESSRVPGISLDGIIATPNKIYGLIVLAILVGFLYWFMLSKTRFGFDLRATGRSETAAVASGVKVKRMVLHVDDHLRWRSRAWSVCRCCSARTSPTATTFQAGLGFAGIAVALFGRNHPSASRRRRCLGLPRPAVQRSADQRRGLRPARPHHPGHHRPVRRHRLRARAPGEHHSSSQCRRRVGGPASQAQNSRRRSQHEHAPSTAGSPRRPLERSQTGPRQAAAVVLAGRRRWRAAHLDPAGDHRCHDIDSSWFARGCRRAHHADPLPGSAVCGPSGPAWSTSVWKG